MRPPDQVRLMTVTDSHPLAVSGLGRVLAAAEQWLAKNRDAINAINVYPVPDGDTGTNMLLTLRSAIEAGERSGAITAGAYLQAFARGALLGARGNSGVILSQMMRGFAAALEEDETVGIDGLCRGLQGAAQTAYAAVSQPVEGTMLTVMRDAAEAASAARAHGEASFDGLLGAAQQAAEESVERTPELLPLLREAGVVDAGGLGVAVVLAGLRLGYLERDLPEAPAVPAGSVHLAAVEHEGHGYCTEYLVEVGAGLPLDRGALLEALADAGGDSILVVGDASALHVHVHMDDPGPALTAGVAAGALRNVKIDNMQLQHEEWAAGHEGAPTSGAPNKPLPAVGLVAVAAGPGIAAAFRELGAAPLLTIHGARPSTGEFIEAARRAGEQHVFLLPNDKDAVMAAEQAAREAPEFISVLPARSLPAGMSAAIAYVADDERAAMERAMRAAIEHVRSVEVTLAGRDAQIDGVGIAAGEPIALLDGVLVAAGATLEDALLAGLAEAVDDASELVTVYLGAEAGVDAGELVRAAIEAAFPQLAVEVVDGGQAHYPYVVGVE